MASDYETLAELTWRFERARDRFRSFKAHYEIMLPQLTGFVTPPMARARERYFELKIKEPLCQAHAEMLECYERLQEMRRRRQSVGSLRMAESQTRNNDTARGEIGGSKKDGQQAMLFGPGAPSAEPPTNTPVTPRSAPSFDVDEAVVPGTDPLLYGLDDADDDEEESDSSGVTPTQLGMSAKGGSEEAASTQAAANVEPADEVSPRRQTLRHILEELQRMQKDSKDVHARLDQLDGLLSMPLPIPSATNASRGEKEEAASVQSGIQAEPSGVPKRASKRKDRALHKRPLEPRQDIDSQKEAPKKAAGRKRNAPEEGKESTQTPGLADRLLAALGSAVAAKDRKEDPAKSALARLISQWKES